MTALQSTAIADCQGNERNNGDCTHDVYGNEFCETSWAFHDCVQGAGLPVAE